MFWFALLLWAVFTVAYEIIRPKPTFEDARPAGLGDFNFPTATEGRAVPLFWGTAKTKGPNLIWYGNFYKKARTEDVKTGMFSSETVTIGYEYWIGMNMAICHGPIDAITGIWCNDKQVSSTRLSVDGTSTFINSPSLFGGVEHGSGGIAGRFTFYSGSSTQLVDTYLDAKISGDMPAYRGVCHLVWTNSGHTGGGWIGNSSNLAPFAFEVERIPDGLNLASLPTPAHEPTAGDANPMNVLYEILTDPDWGLSIAASFIDVPNFNPKGNSAPHLLELVLGDIAEVTACTCIEDQRRHRFQRGLGIGHLVTPLTPQAATGPMLESAPDGHSAMRYPRSR